MKIKTVRRLTVALAVSTMVGCAAEIGDDNDQEVVPVVTPTKVAPAATTTKDTTPSKDMTPQTSPTRGGCSLWGCGENHNARRVRLRHA